MHVGRSGIEGDLDVVFQNVRQQAVNPLSGGFQAQFARAQQPFGCCVDTDHPYRFQHIAAHEFVKQVGADVARPDQRTFDFASHVFWLLGREGGVKGQNAG